MKLILLLWCIRRPDLDIIETYKNAWFTKPFYIGTAFVFLMLFSLFVYTGFIDNVSEQVEIETEFNGIVKSTFTQKRTLYINLENSTRKIKLETQGNREYKDESYSLMRIIEKGDKVYKFKNSDSITLVKNEKSYFFQLEQNKNAPHP